jgi:glycosyltransferase involved in cell wall biosynthesis
VSLVIPVYNGAAYLADSLDRLSTFADSSIPALEIVVVDDGSTDASADIIESHTEDRIQLIRLPTNRGKFSALKVGMAVARGACRAFTDADLPYDLDAIPYMAELVSEQGFHIVVGDRTLSQSEAHGRRPPLRGLSTQVFSFSVRMLVTGELFDTQVGLKGFRGDIAAALFPLITDDGFAGDVELLYIALKYNLAIRRIPVRLLRSGPSTVRLVGHSASMLRCIAGLRRRWATGAYESDGLRAMADQRYWNSERG